MSRNIGHWHRGLVVVAGLVASLGVAQDATVYLTPCPPGTWRWLDAANQPYSAAYQASYTYAQAAVSVTYRTHGLQWAGTLTAANLKPNFAYQLKLDATPDALGAEPLGLGGRWWEQEWLGSAWSGGANLNNKGDGSSPNPNDLTYLARRDLPDATSPTGRRYRYATYRLVEYFVTDETGNATLAFAADDSYHVLWKTSQRSPQAGDGPVLTHTFDVDPASHPAYDTDYGPASVGVFGEWERLPANGIALLPGDYAVEILLTEESFHGSGSGPVGNWAAALSGPATFTIFPPDAVPQLAVLGRGLVIPAGDATPSRRDDTDFGGASPGHPVTRSFTLRNDGTAVLNLGGVTLTGPAAASFAVTATPTALLLPGAETTLALAFTPLNRGRHDATVAIASDDAAHNPYRFAIRGQGPAVVVTEAGSDAGCALAGAGNAADGRSLLLLLALATVPLASRQRRQRHAP